MNGSLLSLGAGCLFAAVLFTVNCWYAWHSAMSGALKTRRQFLLLLGFGVQGRLMRAGELLLARADHGRAILGILCFAGAIAGFAGLAYFQINAATVSDTTLTAIFVWLIIVASFFCGAMFTRRHFEG